MKIFLKALLSIFTLLILLIYFGLIPTWLNNDFYPSSNKYILSERGFLLGLISIGFILFTIIFRKKFLTIDYNKSFLLGFSNSVMILILLILTNWFYPATSTPSIFWGILLSILIVCTPFLLSLAIIKLEEKYKVISVLNILFFLLILNLVSWFIFGRTSILLQVDTGKLYTYGYERINILNNFNEHSPFYYDSFNDFSESTKKEFINEIPITLGKSKIEVIKKIDWESDSLDVEKSPILYVGIIRDIPFLGFIEFGLIAGSGSVTFQSFHIWFFQWFEVRNELTGSS
jgi:hypothetical protein